MAWSPRSCEDSSGATAAFRIKITLHRSEAEPVRLRLAAPPTSACAKMGMEGPTLVQPCAAANGRPAVRSSVAAIREHAVRLRVTPARQVRSTRAAEAVAEPWVVRRFYACPEIEQTYSHDMIQTLEAIVDERGAVRLLEPLHLDRRHRALVTILADEPSEGHETALLSEAALAEDWNRPEEDAAWSHLQQAP